MSLKKSKRWVTWAIVAASGVTLWMVSITIFSTQSIDQALTHQARIGNWASFVLRNDPFFKSLSSSDDFKFIPLTTKNSLNAYVIKFPISFHLFFENNQVLRVSSPLSDERLLPPQFKWSTKKIIDGDVVQFAEGNTKFGHTIIYTKVILPDRLNRPVELVLSQELVDFDHFLPIFTFYSFLFFAIGALIIGLIFERTTGRMIQQIVQLDHSVQTIKQDNGSGVEFLAHQGFKPIQSLAGAIQTFVSTNHLLIDQLSTTSSSLVSQSEDLTKVISNQVNSFVDYSSSITQVSSATEEIAATSNSIMDLTEKIELMAEENNMNVVKAIRNMDNLSKRMDQIEQKTRDFNELLENNNSQVQQISQVSSLIHTINEQLKLISFNAQIEAVSGKGQAQRFKVVANEVRQLAYSVENSVDAIQKQIDAIMNNSHQANSMFKQVSKLISEINQFLHESVVFMNEFSEKAAKNVASAKTINRSTTEQMSALADIAQSMNYMRSRTGEMQHELLRLVEKASDMRNSGAQLNHVIESVGAKS